MHPRPDRILPKDPNEEINYHNLEPGDTVVFDTQIPVRDGTLGIVTHVADNGVDAFIFSSVRPFCATSIVHVQDPRLNNETFRASMLGRGVFRLTGSTEKFRPLFFTVAAMHGELTRLRTEIRRLKKIVEPAGPEVVEDEEEEDAQEEVAAT